MGSGSPESSVYANAGSIYFNTAGTSSGTQAYLKSQNANSTGWVGIATTDQLASAQNLQQVSNVGASTTNILYLLGGLTAPSSTVTSTFTSLGSANFYPSTTTNPVTIRTPGIAADTQFSSGLSVTSSNSNAGLQIGTYGYNTDLAPALYFGSNLNVTPDVFDAGLQTASGTLVFYDTSTAGYYNYLYGQNGAGTEFILNDLSASGTTARAAAQIINLSNSSSSAVLRLRWANSLSGGSIVQHVGSGSPEGSVYANAGSIYFNTAGTSSGTQAYLKSQNANSTGWVGIATTDQLASVPDLNWTYNASSNSVRNATSTTDIYLGSTATSTGAPVYFDLSGGTNGTSTVYFGNATNTNVVVGGTSTTNTGLSPNFILNGNDLFVGGNIGSASSVYTNGEFVAGSSSTHYGNGYITKNDTGSLQITTVSGTAVTNDITQLWSTNSNPQLLSTFTISKPTEMLIRDQYAYVIDNSNLEVIDITDPAHPLERTFLTMPANIVSMQADEKYIYLLASDSNIYAIDYTSPGGPSNVGTIPFVSGKMILQGDIAYALKATGISIFRLKGLSETLLGTMSGSFSSVTAFAVHGNYAYVGNNSLHVIDISNPASPTEVGTLLYGPFLKYFVADDTYVYGTDGTSTNLAIFDVHKPNVPTLATTVPGFGVGGRLTKTGRYLYVADDSGIEVTDVLATSTASIVKRITGLVTPTNFIADGRYGYAIDGSTGTGFFGIYQLPTTEVEGLDAHSLVAGTARVLANAEVVGTLNTYALNAGAGGITSKGPVNVDNTIFVNLPNSTSTAVFDTGLEIGTRNNNYGASIFRFNNGSDYSGIGFTNSLTDYNSSSSLVYFNHTIDQFGINLMGSSGLSGAPGAILTGNNLNESDNTGARASFELQNGANNSSTAVLRLINGAANSGIVEHVGGGSPEGLVYANAGSIYFNAAGTSSGTQAYLKTQNSNSTGWVGIATTDSVGGNLQTVSNIGATTTNKLYLLGGLNVSSSLLYTPSTSSQPFRIQIPSTTSTGAAYDFGLTINATNSSIGQSFWQIGTNTENISGLTFANDVMHPFTNTSTGIFGSWAKSQLTSFAQNTNGDLSELITGTLASDASLMGAFNLISIGSTSQTAILALANGDGTIVQHLSKGSPENVVYANAGSIYFRTDGYTSGTQAYLKTQNANKTGWVGIATTDELSGSLTLQQVSNNGATTTNELYLLGGLITNSSTVTSTFNVQGSFTYTPSTSSQPFRIQIPATTSTGSAFDLGLTITATNTNAGHSFWQLDGGTGNYSGIAFTNNVNTPFTSTSTGIYGASQYGLFNAYAQNTQGDVAQLQAVPLSSGYSSAIAPFELVSLASTSPTAILGLVNSNGSVVFHYGKGSPEGNVYANLGSLYFRSDGSASGTQAYIKTQDANSAGWVGLATTDMLSGGVSTAITTSTNVILSTASNGTLAVQGDIAVTTNYTSGLWNAINVGSLSTSTVMSTTTLSGAWLPVLNGNILYVFNWTSGTLYSYDLSNQYAPAQLDALTGFSNPYSAQLVGPYLYVGDTNGLQIVDISSAANMKVVRSLTLSGSTKRGLQVKDGYAYLASQSGNTLYVIDVHNPLNPFLVNTQTISGVSEVAVNDSYLYVAASTAPFLQVFDIRNATSPRQIATVNSNIGSGTDIAIAGDQLYFASATATYQYDISNPASPSFSQAVADGSATDHKIAVTGRRLYSYNPTSGNLRIYDLGGTTVGALRANSALVGRLEVNNDLLVSGNVNINGALNVGTSGINSAGRVTAASFQGDITSSTLSVVGSTTNPVLGSSAMDIRNMATQGNFLYTLEAAYDMMVIYDISDPRTPKYVSNITGALGSAISISVAGDRAYVGGSGGLDIFDISNPYAPIRIGTFSSPVNQTVDAQYLSGKYLFTAGSNKWTLFDIADPQNTNFATSSVTSSGATYGGFAVQGRYAYWANDAGSPQFATQVIDFSNPTSSRFDGFINTTNTVRDIAVNGKYAYIANDTNGLTIWDISATSNRSVVSEITVPTRSSNSAAHKIQLIGTRYAAVGYGDAGLVIFDISSSTKPTVAYQSFDGIAAGNTGVNAITVQGRYLYFFHSASATKYIGVLDLGGAEFSTANIGNLLTTNLNVALNGKIGGDLYVGNGGYFGNTGIFSEGPISVYATNSTSSFAGTVQIKNLIVSDTMAATTGTSNFREIVRYTSSTSQGGLCLDDSSTANTCPTTGINGASIFADGNVTANAFDLAERYMVSGTSTAGDVLVLDSATSATVKTSTGIPYDTHIIGIASITPGLRLGWLDPASSVDVALNGRVPTRVNLENGPIHIGDPLTTSHVPGVAMKATRPGEIVGYALEEAYTTSTIEVFVNVGYNANTALNTDGSISLLSDNVVVGAANAASSTATTINSWGLTFRGSVWDASSSSTINRDFTLLTDVISATTSAFAIRNASSSDLFAVDASGSVRIAGDLGIMGRLYPSARGSFQTQYYLYVDDTSSTNQYISTNADGFQSESSYDLAERYHSDDSLKPGDVVTPATNGSLGAKKAEGNAPIMGVVSTKPGFILGGHATDTYPIALTGRVPTRVSTENGAIHAGDLLGLSGTAGVAAKATENGFIVGIALEDYSNSGTGLIQVLIEPQWNGSFSSGSAAPSGPSAPAGVSGFADIAAGSVQVTVHFSSLTAYPNIRIAPYGQVDGTWWIDSVTDSGFRIVMQNAQSHDVRFSWTAVPSQTGDYLYNSDGTFGTIDPTTGIGPAMGPGSVASSTDSGSTSSTDSGSDSSSSTDSGTGSGSETDGGSTSSTDDGSSSSTSP
ncbi:MAG TPA: hypothetical protein VMU11_00485 [Verrucomicrobiae bacterium]|nr:hypothetical protein [Verrucomicrobiae bacterium]